MRVLSVRRDPSLLTELVLLHLFADFVSQKLVQGLPERLLLFEFPPLDLWKGISFNYTSTDTADFAETPTANV